MTKVVPPHFRAAVDAIPDAYPGLREQLRSILEWMESPDPEDRIHRYPTVMLALGLWEAELRTHCHLLEERIDGEQDPFGESQGMLPFDIEGSDTNALMGAQSLMTMLAALREAWDPEVICSVLRLKENAPHQVLVEGKKTDG